MLSIKEIDAAFLRMGFDGKLSYENIFDQAKAYVSLVEKIKGIVPESEYIVERVRELKSFIGEL